jgi:hypothetical protein
MRSGVVSIVLAFLLAPFVASAQPGGGVVPVARAANNIEVALAGTRLLMGRYSRRGVRLLSAPVTGGKALSLFSRAARGPRLFLAMNDLDASSERVVFSLVEFNPATEGIVRVSVWAGAPEGPFTPLVRRRGGAWIPIDVQASGMDVAFTEIQPVGDVARHWVFRGGAEGVRLSVPPNVQRVELAGSLAAYVEDERRLVVKDWTVGAERLRHTTGGAIKDLDLAEDGRVLLHVFSRRVLELVDASGGVHRVMTGGAAAEDNVRLAGGQAVLRFSGEGDAHIAVIDLATGQRRRLSPSSLDLGQEDAQLDAEGELVAWAANGCVFAAPHAGPGSSLVPPGPCPRAEISLEGNQPERLQGRTARVRLSCITAPPPGCRGTIRLELDRPLGKARYLIPAGRRESVRVPLSSRGIAALERQLRFPLPGGGAAVEVRTTLADGARPRSSTPNNLIVLRPDRS